MLAVLLLCSAAVSGTEIAFFSLTHKQITHIRNTQDPRERKITRLLQQPKRLLATLLILNNLINVAFVTFSTYLLWHIIGIAYISKLIMLVYTLISTTCIVLFGEVIPKIYANQNNLWFAKRATGFLVFAVPALRPLSDLLLHIGNLFGKSLSPERHELSVDKLNRALALTTTQSASAVEKDFLQGVVNFGNLMVKQIMQPRMEIQAIDVRTDFHQLLDFVSKSQYAKFPVYRTSIDHIEGILYTKNLLAHLDKDKHFRWQPLLRKCFFVPENKKIDTLLLAFQEKKVQIAIVVDEYGGTSGLITLEDIIEEIIGDITDEFQQDAVMYRKLDDKTFILESKISLNDFCKIIGESPATFEPVKGESESLGGLLLELHGRLPRAGIRICFQRFTFTVIAADPRKIQQVKVEISPKMIKKAGAA